MTTQFFLLVVFVNQKNVYKFKIQVTLDKNFLLCLINGICLFENKTRECEERCHYADSTKQMNHT